MPSAPVFRLLPAFRLLLVSLNLTSPGFSIPLCCFQKLTEKIAPESIDRPKYRLLFGRAAATVLYPFGIDSKEVEDWACGGLQFSLPKMK